VRVLFIKQDHASPAGLVGEAFTGLGYDVSEFTVVPRERYHSPDVTVTFPDPLAYDAIVAFGAAWAVYDVAAIGSWIGDEIAFTRQAITGGVPVLGICFGGQMLAAALGGQVTRAPQPEIGWNVIESDEPSLIDPGPWFQWHSDRFELPAGIPVLARTAPANQAFTAGRSLGLQFHPSSRPRCLSAGSTSARPSSRPRGSTPPRCLPRPGRSPVPRRSGPMNWSAASSGTSRPLVLPPRRSAVPDGRGAAYLTEISR
jgi:GMP synthase-like glutamine amidotransferase